MAVEGRRALPGERVARERREVGRPDRGVEGRQGGGRHDPKVVRRLGRLVDTPVALDDDGRAARAVDTQAAAGLHRDERARCDREGHRDPGGTGRGAERGRKQRDCDDDHLCATIRLHGHGTARAASRFRPAVTNGSDGLGDTAGGVRLRPGRSTTGPGGCSRASRPPRRSSRRSQVERRPVDKIVRVAQTSPLPGTLRAAAISARGTG